MNLSSVGWKVNGQEVHEDTNGKTPKKTTFVNWEERTLEDYFTDVRNFAIDLANSLEGRLEKCLFHAPQFATFFDIEETVKLMCGKKLGSGRVQVEEEQLESHGLDEFSTFFKEVCQLKHIKEAEDNCP